MALGGGSVAWIDRGGLLAVGPKSAGAAPGTRLLRSRRSSSPTVTDAQYVLGYLDPAYFEEGELQFDAGAAAHGHRRVYRAAPGHGPGCGRGRHLPARQQQHGGGAWASCPVQRGYDPREFVLVVAGGAGPIHAAAIARELEIPLILIPRESSVFCAAGMLISDLKHDYVRTYATDIDRVDTGEVNALFRDHVGNRDHNPGSGSRARRED